MNITEKEIKLKPKTTVGFLSPVTIEDSTQQKITSETKIRISHEEQLKTVTEKGISLKDCAMTGSDFHALVELLYNNLDLFATSLKELTGCTVLKHRIETGNNPPVNSFNDVANKSRLLYNNSTNA